MGALVKFLRWFGERLAIATLIVAFGVAACALRLFLKDNVDFDQWRQNEMRSLNGERAKVQSDLGDVHQRMAKIAAEIVADQARARQTDGVIAQLKDLESTWDRLVGNREQQKENAERLANLTAQRAALTTAIQNLQQEFARATWERDGLEIALSKLDAKLGAVEAQRSAVMHYLERAWNYPVGRSLFRMPIKRWVPVFLALYFAGPTLGKIGTYFYRRRTKD